MGKATFSKDAGDLPRPWLLGAAAAVPPALVLAQPGAARAAACESGKLTPDGPCGMGLEEAWSQNTTGNPQEIVAYTEGGINCQDSQAHAPPLYQFNEKDARARRAG